MAIFGPDGEQLSPCICSWARFALSIKDMAPQNHTECTQGYWEKVVDNLAAHVGINDEQLIENAKAQFPPWG